MKERLVGNAHKKSLAITVAIFLSLTFSVGCKFPVLHSSDPQPPVENLGKNLRPKGSKLDFGSGLDSKAKEVEANLGYK